MLLQMAQEVYYAIKADETEPVEIKLGKSNSLRSFRPKRLKGMSLGTLRATNASFSRACTSWGFLKDQGSAKITAVLGKVKRITWDQGSDGLILVPSNNMERIIWDSSKTVG